MGIRLHLLQAAKAEEVSAGEVVSVSSLCFEEYIVLFAPTCRFLSVFLGFAVVSATLRWFAYCEVGNSALDAFRRGEGIVVPGVLTWTGHRDAVVSGAGCHRETWAVLVQDI